ncbi:uncharacterized protein RCO7_03844 [Rhynchosporium graminicola]|uniref:Shelterin complex subunit TPP1/Est3 domain-containing protein n=1 Tax=Rhynchosporium graminicola TaxID=2792576 RepID=A0A1E1LLU4_9HELO|nr:uncharacterized protein RCO7_03844 [Rhynchosporium commune]
MASALQQPWISTLVESELKTALNSLKSYVSGQLELVKGNRHCRPGEVEIRFSKQRQVQVTEFPGGLRNPYDAVLSDGYHHIHAIFDIDAAQSFAEKTHRNYQEIAGGIIVLNSYYLIVNSALAPTLLTLRILDFKLQGSEGSPLIGRPKDILMHGEVALSAGKLDRLCAPTQESTQAQLSSSTSQDKSSQLSGGFATQMDHGTAGLILSPAVAQNRRTTNDDAFVARLAGLAKDDQAEIPNSTDELVRVPILGPISAGKADAMKSKLDKGANMRFSQASIPLISSGNVEKELGSKPADQALENHGHLYSRSKDAEKENSLEHVETQQSPPDQPVVHTVQLQSAPLFVDLLQRNDAFEGLKRVPRQFVRISEDQQNLLERNDCWYEPQVGDRPRYANVPPKVMDDLTEFRIRQPTKPLAEVLRVIHSPQDSEDDSDDKSDDDSAYDDTAEQPISDYDEESLGASQKPVYHDNPELSSNDKPSPHSSQIQKGRIPSSGPIIVDLRSGGDDDTDDEDRISWEPTPDSDDVAHHPSIDRTASQPQSISELPSTPSTPFAPSWEPQVKPHARAPVNIPSSSPTKEEELELAIPYAVGDIFDPEDVQEQGSANMSQELPSTAPPSSRYIQVKRTPYVKSRSFDEVSLRRTATGSNRTKDDGSSDPVIPATFNETSSSNMQVSSLVDQAPTSVDRLSSTQMLPKEHMDTHAQTNATHDGVRVENNRLASKEIQAKEQTGDKTFALDDRESAESRISSARHQRLSQNSRVQRLGGDLDTTLSWVSPSPKLNAGHLLNAVEPSTGIIHAQMGRNTVLASPQTHLSKRDRQMVFSDVKFDETTSEDKELAELLFEEKRRAQVAKRNFRAREKLTRLGPGATIEPPILTSSPHLVVATNSRKPLIPEQHGPRVLLSSTPDPFQGNDQVLAGASDGWFPAQDRLDSEEGQSPSIEVSQDSSPIRPSSGAHEYRPVPNNEEECVTHVTPQPKPVEQSSHPNSLAPSSPSSALPEKDDRVDEYNDAHVDECIDEFSFHEASALGISAAESNQAGRCKDVTSTPRSAEREISAKPEGDDQDELVEKQSLGYEAVPAGDWVTPKQFQSEAQEQTLPHHISQSEGPSLRRQRQQNDSRSTGSSSLDDLTYDKFLFTYPEYTGDKKCFTRALVCLEWLRKKRMPPWSICDDFVRAYVEYEPFLRNLVKENKSTMTAWEYYDSHVKAIVFERRFIDDEDKLASAISLLNPLLVQTLRRAYNTPSADTSRTKVLKRSISNPVVPQITKPSVTTSPSIAPKTVRRLKASPELGLGNIQRRRHAREPFFETRSQLLSEKRTEEHAKSTRSVADDERSDKKKRKLPWNQKIENQPRISSAPIESRHVPGRESPSVRSVEAQKRRHSDGHRRATLPPRLRSSVEKSPTATRIMHPPRPISRNKDVVEEARQTSESMDRGARASPELPDFTEKWVAQQQPSGDFIIEEAKSSRVASLPPKQIVQESLGGRRKSELSSTTDSPTSTKKRPYKDFKEVARLYAERRRSGGLSSRASTPNSTPAKRFCTKPKTVTQAK